MAIKHTKTNTIADWTQAQLDAQIALGNFAPGTLLADIALPSDWNDNHTIDNATITDAMLVNSKENSITGTTSADFWSGAKTFINFATTVRGTVLTGLSLATSQVIAATDTVLLALGYLQAQITALTTTVAGKVASTRAINTTAPLSGGGDLSADRTLTTSMATNKLIGRGTAGTGVMEEITLGTNLSFTGTTLNAAGAGAGASGITTVDFGAFPGSLHTTTVVTGQTNLLADSIIKVEINTKDSAGHSADEHRLEPIKCSYSNIVPGDRFTIEAIYAGEHPVVDNQQRKEPTPNSNRPMAYGVFNVFWEGNWT